jgi:hypothetical protein
MGVVQAACSQSNRDHGAAATRLAVVDEVDDVIEESDWASTNNALIFI